MGAHTIGSMNTLQSGHTEGWTTAENQSVFDNSYYKALIMNGWGPKYNRAGEWRRVDQGNNIYYNQIMLTTDMALVYQANEKLMYCIKITGDKERCRDLYSSVKGVGDDKEVDQYI